MFRFRLTLALKKLQRSVKLTGERSDWAEKSEPATSVFPKRWLVHFAASGSLLTLDAAQLQFVAPQFV